MPERTRGLGTRSLADLDLTESFLGGARKASTGSGSCGGGGGAGESDRAFHRVRWPSDDGALEAATALSRSRLSPPSNRGVVPSMAAAKQGGHHHGANKGGKIILLVGS